MYASSKPKRPSTKVPIRGAKPVPLPTKKTSPKQLTVVLPNGNRVGANDIGKNKGTPKPKPMPKDKSNKKYFADQKKYANSKENKK